MIMTPITRPAAMALSDEMVMPIALPGVPKEGRHGQRGKEAVYDRRNPGQDLHQRLGGARNFGWHIPKGRWPTSGR
jgi:hypothetical protein